MWVREKPLTYSTIAKWWRALYQVWREKLFTFAFTNIMYFSWKKKKQTSKQQHTHKTQNKQTKPLERPNLFIDMGYVWPKILILKIETYFLKLLLCSFGISFCHLPNITFHFSLQKGILNFKIILSLQKKTFEGLSSISPKSLKTLWFRPKYLRL